MELKAFLGLCYCRGVQGDNLHLVSELWAGDANPVFAATMSLARFKFLLSHLRLDRKADRDTNKESDKFAAAREVFNLFNEACTKHLQCGDELCFDETLYPNRGRGFSFKQYMPAKPSKYGFLYKSLNDGIRAYTYRCHIYAGKPAKEPTEDYIQGVEETVMELLRRYKQKHEIKGRNITFDRFYTSVDLADSLLEEFNMTCVGTLANRRKGLPAEFKALREEGDYLVLYEPGGKSIHSWITNTKSGKKNVMALTTTQPILGRTRDDDRQKPAILKRYDFAMNGTDRVDQLMQSYTVRMKSRRWPMSVLSYLMDTARVNSRTIALIQVRIV